jgi:hypothetical protein
LLQASAEISGKLSADLKLRRIFDYRPNLRKQIAPDFYLSTTIGANFQMPQNIVVGFRQKLIA